MKASMSTRLAKLEESLNPPGILVLPWKDGETREACIRRHGYDPSDRRATFILADKCDLMA